MRRFRTISTTVILVALAAEARGLECLADVPISKQTAEADVVLLGRVTDISHGTRTKEQAFYRLVTIEVDQLWKGSTPRQIELHQPPVAGGVDFNLGQQLVIFGRRLTEEMKTRNDLPASADGFIALECFSKPASRVDLRDLGSGYPPQQK